MGLFRDIGLLSAVHVTRRGCFEPLTVRHVLAGFSARYIRCAALPSLDTGFGHFQSFAHQGCASTGNARFFHRAEDVAALLHVVEEIVAEEAAASEDCDVEDYHAGAERVCGVVPPVACCQIFSICQIGAWPDSPSTEVMTVGVRLVDDLDGGPSSI
jgi:hypothetical protein